MAINAEARRFFTDEDGTLGPGTEPGSSIDPNFHEEGWRVFARELLARVRGELPFEGELALIMPRGEERTITIRVSVPPEARSTLARVFVSFLDVTRQKRAEAELLRSLADNQALIRDLRYRTMNNMQMISSMLRFEEERAPDERSAAAFRSINERIEAKAMVHETLSSNGELAGRPLALRHGAVEAQDISLPIDAAVPFGLAFGELISNSLRHAFRDRESGRLWLRLALSGGELKLEVEDDGVGLPEGFDYRVDGKLEIQNAILIVEGQLRGTIGLASGKDGTKWKMSFPI